MKKIIISLFILFSVADLSFADIAVIGDLSRENAVKPGERYEGAILVKNTGTKASDVRILKNDYLFYADGRTLYNEPDTAPRSNAAWIIVSPSQLTVPPNGTASFHYTVQTPNRGDLKGSYWSLLMVEPLAPPAPETMDPGKKKIAVGVQTVIRYGVQVVTAIEESGECKLRFPDRKLTGRNGRRVFELDIENVGERLLVPAVWVDLYNSEGAQVGHFESIPLRIYPGCSVRHRIDLTDVPPGKYNALAVADNRDDNVFGGQYELVIE